MAQKNIGNPMDDSALNSMNHNFTELYKGMFGPVSGSRLEKNYATHFPYYSLENDDLDYFWEHKVVIASANVKNNPFGTGCEVMGFRGKTKDDEKGRVWVTQIAVSYGAAGVLGESKIRHVIGNEDTNELVDKSEWNTLGFSVITGDMLDKNYAIKNYLSGSTYNLNDITEKGNYMVNADVKNNPYGVGCALSVDNFKTSLTGAATWIVQRATAYGTGLGGMYVGRNAFRVLSKNDTTNTVTPISDWSDKRETPIKILTIGNSFGLDTTKYIPQIAKSLGVNLITCNLYISGGLLSDHDSNIKNNNNPYRIYNRSHVDGVITDDYVTDRTIDDALSLHDYDYVIFNQASNMSGVYGSFQPYLNDIIDYVKNKQPNIKVAFMPTWAYSSDFDDDRFDKYDRDQIKMYNEIQKTYKSAMVDSEFDLIIPVGTAIQNARTDEYMLNKDNELTRDGYHLGDTGCYIAGITYIKTFFENTKVKWSPSTLSNKSSYLANIASDNSILNPFNITNI